MRRISNKLKLSLLLSCIVCLWNCTENIDTSARYVFSEETILSYLEKHEAYSSYVDILKQVNISKLSDHRISDPSEVVHLNQKVMVRVESVEIERKRISLALEKE